jgi:AAA15 family ATPase/GTPase
LRLLGRSERGYLWLTKNQRFSFGGHFVVLPKSIWGYFSVMVKRLNLKSLFLDPNNYRFIDADNYTHVPDNFCLDDTAQKRTNMLILGKKNQHVSDLINSFKKNGYLPVDHIQVRQIDSEKYLVIEGNRRVATLKFLEREYKEKAIDLGKLDPDFFSEIPVVFYQGADEQHHLILMGLKHISGNKKWPALNQATLIKKLKNEYGMSEDDICQAIGMQKRELKLTQRTLVLIDSYKKSDYGDQFESEKYFLFREIVRSPELREWIAWNESTYQVENQAHLQKLFSWISWEEGIDDDTDEVDSVIKKKPVFTKTKYREIRELARIINDPNALKKIDNTRSIAEASLTSEVLGNSMVANALAIIKEQINVAFKYSGYMDSEKLNEVEEATNKLKGLLISRNREPKILSGNQEKKVSFNAIIEQHFSSITIGAYKKFNQFTVENLNRINLFAGINNSGKTSLLEAIYLLSQQNDVTALLETTRRRGKVATTDALSPLWLQEQIQTEMNISGIFDNKETQLKIRKYQDEQEVTDKSFYLTSFELISQFSNQEQRTITPLFEKEKDRETHYRECKILCPAVFSSPFSLHHAQTLKECNKISLETNSKAQIIQFIRDKIDKGVINIELVDEFSRFLVTHQDFDKAPDLTQFGEGVQRIFYIALQFAYAKNGIVLIDEFENAIHTGLLYNFTRFIQELAYEFNTQVFLTSHSKECLDAFIKNDYRLEDISAYTLAVKNDKAFCHIKIILPP